MTDLLQEKVLGPLGLDNTTDSGHGGDPRTRRCTPSRPSGARPCRSRAGAPFYEESTYWNPSWTITHGAIQTTNIYDLARPRPSPSAPVKLLSRRILRGMVSTDLRGKTTALPGCTTCFPQSEDYTYGLGLPIVGNWLMQNPLFSGSAAVEAYLPSQKIAVAVAVTYEPAAFDDTGAYKNEADRLFRKIGAQLAPTDAPPMAVG